MKTRRERNGIVWIDLENPTRQEVIDVALEYALDTMTAEELLSPSLRSRVDVSAHYLYLILHFPALRHSHTAREQEIDFVVGHDFLITTHYDTIDPLHKFTSVFDVGTALEHDDETQHAGHIFYSLVKRLYKAVDHESEQVRRSLAMIEEHIFSDHQVEMVAAISHAARDLLNLRQTIEPHRDVLKSLEAEGSTFFGETFSQHLRALENEYYRVHNRIMRNTESLHELRETNNTLLTTRQNETMRSLTIMALLTFPLSLFVTIFEVSAADNPIKATPYGFRMIVAAVIALGFVMILYFKRKKWL